MSTDGEVTVEAGNGPAEGDSAKKEGVEVPGANGEANHKRKRDDDPADPASDPTDGADAGVAAKKSASEGSDGNPTPAPATEGVVAEPKQEVSGGLQTARGAPAAKEATGSAATAPGAEQAQVTTGQEAASTLTSIFLSTTPVPPGTEELKAGHVRDEMDVPSQLVGRIIGRGGETIRDLQLRSGCQIQINQNFPDGHPRKVIITGPPSNVSAAKQMVTTVMEAGPQGLQSFPVMSAETTTSVIECPPHLVGRLIGKGGETIRELQARSRSRVQIDQSMADHENRKVIVTGDPQSVALGEAMVRAIMENGPAGMHAIQGQYMLGGALPMQQPQQTAGVVGSLALAAAPASTGVVGSDQPYVVDCPKQLVGRVIGRGGETIQMLQAKTGCKIQIDQNVPEGAPCKITVSQGPPQNTAMAVQMVMDVMQNGPARLHTMQSLVAGVPNYGSFYAQPAAAATTTYGQAAYYSAPAPAPAPAPYYGQQQYQTAPYSSASPTQFTVTPGTTAYTQQPQYGQPQQQQAAASYGQTAVAPRAYAPSPAPAPAATAGAYGAQPAQVYGNTAYNPAAAQPMAAYAQHSVPAPAPAPPAAPSGEWQECKTAEGISYWYNATMGQSQWNKP